LWKFISSIDYRISVRQIAESVGSMLGAAKQLRCRFSGVSSFVGDTPSLQHSASRRGRQKCEVRTQAVLKTLEVYQIPFQRPYSVFADRLGRVPPATG
jgi:hypothetical protein